MDVHSPIWQFIGIALAIPPLYWIGHKAPAGR